MPIYEVQYNNYYLSIVLRLILFIIDKLLIKVVNKVNLFCQVHQNQI